MQETEVQSLGWKNTLEKEMAAYSNILAWKISWTEKPGRLQSMRWQRVGHNGVTKTSTELQSAKTFLSVGTWNLAGQ